MYENEMPSEESRQSTGDSHSSPQASSSNSKPKSTAKIRCAYCGKLFHPSETTVMPFCSKRCQQIDLGMWLNESYGMPVEDGSYSHDEEAY